MLPTQRYAPDPHFPSLLHPPPILYRILLKHRIRRERRHQSPRLRILRGVEIHIRGRERARIDSQPIVEGFDVYPLSTRDERDSHARLRMEGEMPQRRRMLRVLVEPRPGQRTLAPGDALDVLGELSRVRVRDHPADVVANDVDLLTYLQVRGH